MLAHKSMLDFYAIEISSWSTATKGKGEYIYVLDYKVFLIYVDTAVCIRMLRELFIELQVKDAEERSLMSLRFNISS